MSDPRTAPRAEPPSERENALNVANSRDALEFAARVLQTRASMVPVGHEDRTKGPSTYNWLTYAVLLLRQAAASLPPGDAPQPCEWRHGMSPAYVAPSCRPREEWYDVERARKYKCCPYCTHPLVLVPAEEPTK